MNLNLDFNQAKTKHIFFKTKVRGYLLGSEANADSFQVYLKELGDWINSLASKYNVRLSALLEANYLYNELVKKTINLIKFHNTGNDDEAKKVFIQIEKTGDKFLQTLQELEVKIKSDGIGNF